MSIWNTLKTHAKAQFLDVIQWMEDDKNTIVYRYPVFNQAIQDGGKLVVREGQFGVFLSEGKLSDAFGPGTYEISSRTKAISSFFESIKYSLNYPYKGDIFFVSAKRFTDQKWGTANPIMMSDPEIGPVRIRAFGAYAFRVTQPAVFIRELVGNQGLFSTEDINGQLKRKLVAMFADAVGESNIPVLKLNRQYMDLGDAIRERLSPKLEADYGIQLVDFVVENISLPPEVEKMLDKRTSMGLIGDMNAFTQFQTANAIETAAARPGGANPMLDAGMGLAMGGAIGQQMMGAQRGGVGFNPAAPYPAAPPPPPPPALLHYNGAGGSGQFGPAEVAQKVAANRAGQHHVWMPGWPGWKSWTEVPEVVALVPPAAPPPPPMNNETFHYHGDGQGEFPAGVIAAKVAANPNGRHLVWKNGWDGWKEAKTIPEIMNAGGPPAPPMPPPPPFAG